MKINDTYPVMIAGQVVAQAKVTGLEDGTATLVIPATRVVMATRTELTIEEPEAATVQILTDRPAETEEASTEEPKVVSETITAESVESAPIVAGEEAHEVNDKSE